MTNLEAIARRISRRSYLGTPIAPEQVNALRALIDGCNTKSGLHIQFIEDGSKAFKGLSKSYGMFSGVRSLLALVGKKADAHLEEKLGYYGELLVLEATKLGLGTCWVGGTFDAKSCPCELGTDERLACVIPIGNVPSDTTRKEKTILGLVHRKARPLEYFYTADTALPDWFIEGVKAVQRAPSAINRQPVHLYYKDGVATATLRGDGNPIDLGIAKLHFELAAGGSFAMGNNAIFTKA